MAGFMCWLSSRAGISDLVITLKCLLCWNVSLRRSSEEPERNMYIYRFTIQNSHCIYLKQWPIVGKLSHRIPIISCI